MHSEIGFDNLFVCYKQFSRVFFREKYIDRNMFEIRGVFCIFETDQIEILSLFKRFEIDRRLISESFLEKSTAMFRNQNKTTQTCKMDYKPALKRCWYFVSTTRQE